MTTGSFPIYAWCTLKSLHVISCRTVVAAKIMEANCRSAYQEFKVDLIESTILDTDVLDNLISKCVITLDDREEIDSLSDQSNRNHKLLEILMHRPYNTFTVFVEAMKNSDQKCHTSLVERMEAKVLDKDLTLQNAQLTDETTGIKNTVKLIRWYKTIVHEINIDKTGILDKLFARDVIDREINEKLSSEKMTSHEKNRKLLGTIVRKDISSTFPIFLEVLREDSCYKDYADKIEETHVTQNDLELLSIDLMVDQIEKWKIESNIYVQTRATNHVLTSINNNNCVSVIGPSGSGKTAIVRHVALQMERLGYTILTVTDAKEIKDQYKSDRKTLYVVDDMCGNFTASQSRIEEWKKSMDDIKGILENCNFIFNNKLKEKHLTGKAPKVEEIIEVIIEVCEIDEHLTGRKLKSQLEILTGTFVTCDAGIYKTIHDKLFDFLAVYFGTQEELISILIKYAKPRFVRERFAVTKDNESEQYLIPISDDKLQIQINPESVVPIIQTGSTDFLNKMFVIKEHDINCFAEKQYERFGIVIPEGMLKHFIDRWFDDLTRHTMPGVFMDTSETGALALPLSSYLDYCAKLRKFDKFFKNTNRLMMNISFRIALRTYMGQLTTEKIASLIHTAEDGFLNQMFVITEDDIIDNAENGYEWFGIVIPDDLLQQYIEQYFNRLTKKNLMVPIMYKIRAFQNVKGRTALRTHMKQLTKKNIASLIQNAVPVFFNTMFVMTEEDIKDNAEKRYECFGIVIPDDLLQQYITKWFDHLTNERWFEDAIDKNRLLNNVLFRCALRNYTRQLTTEKVASIIQMSTDNVFNKMFVMTEEDIKDNVENRFECFGIVIPYDLLHQYIQRWLDDLTKTISIEFSIDRNRTMINDIFRFDTRNYLKKLTLDKIALLIQTSSVDFINKMFVMTEEDIRDNAGERYICLGIVILDNFLQHYFEKWLKCLTKTRRLEECIDENIPFKNIAFRAALNDYLRQLSIANIASLIWDANDDFLNKMFVMTEEDINDDTANRHGCFSIVIPSDLLLQYMERWFKRLPKTRVLEKFIDENRPLKNIIFRTALCNYMRQLNTETIASLILNANDEFLQKMFAISEDDINDMAQKKYERFGIVISGNLQQHYVERWLRCLSETSDLEKCIDENRPLKNVAFRAALNDYLRQLNVANIASLIWDANDDFLNKMFVMTEEDITDNAENLYECFGIVIPDDLLQHYIERWLKCLTETSDLEKCIDRNRPLKNAEFCTALRDYLRRLNTVNIAFLIWDADDDFLNRMFVMTEDDIKNDAENRYECFGIVIPNDLLQQYIDRWLKSLTETSKLGKCIDANRPLKNDTFRSSLCNYMRQLNREKIASLVWDANDEFLQKMFVMTEDDIKDNAENRYECYGIVIADELLQHYIKKWLNRLTKTSELEKCIDTNRPLRNVAFRAALSDYMRKLNTANIASLIWDANDDFFNKMFVMTEDDIRDNAENRYENLGIVIPAELLKHYIDIWLKRLTKTRELQKRIDENRPQKNALFRSAFRTYMEQPNTETIANLIQTGSTDFLNTMFVMTADEIKDNGETRYACVGIVIPQDLLQLYIEKWFEGLTITSELEKFIGKNRPLKNTKFRIALCTYFRQLNLEKIASLILEGEGDYLNTMFVMTDVDIKENAENLYERIGIVIPDDMLQQYIERWFLHLSDRPQTKSFMERNRLLMNVTFCTALRTFMKQLNTEQIAFFIQTGSTDFLNAMFVMTEDDIKDDGGNRYEWFGIVIPDDFLLLQQYIDRWFQSVTEAISVKEYMNVNRPLMNATFRTALRTYMSQLDIEEIGILIRTGSGDFLNTMFVLTENDIFNDNKYRFECFGIIIPDDLLQQYIERWLDCMTKTESVMEFVGGNRSSMNVLLQTELEPYMNQINSEK
ncbi:unnamed protein product [Mytilus coruscus]|uniref:CARD domain-containing protein n=1 Tax=Mytilus coruscus TaxID=42192 RepID=A0A6J8A3F3_MYTCO|nr:unnamed protein product [Mytilus coruscus]